MDDNQFPQGGKRSIRDMLSKLNEDKEKLESHPLYKEGYDDGYEQGRQEAHRMSQRTISGLVRIYDQLS